jgi:hypothetical protein
VAIKVGNDRTIAPATLSTFTTVANQTSLAGGTQTFQTSSSAKGRYVLIWFTKLPPLPGGGKYQAFVYNVAVRGTG